jgi:hypothetical protein
MPGMALVGPCAPPVVMARGIMVRPVEDHPCVVLPVPSEGPGQTGWCFPCLFPRSAGAGEPAGDRCRMAEPCVTELLEVCRERAGRLERASFA